MLIAIISDLHDNLANLDICLNWCHQQKVEKIICCGDITNEDTLIHLATKFCGDIFIVQGNAEIYTSEQAGKYKNIKHCGEIARINIDNCQIGFCHEPIKTNQLRKASSSTLNFIFYGHTHKPWLEKDGQTIIANPGNLAGTYNQATFATLKTNTKELKLHLLADI